MGMMIDEAIEDMLAIQSYYNDETQDGYVGFAKEDNESVDLAIDIMRKYQEIEQIVEDRYGKPIYKFMDAIVKVVEDGKID